MEGSGHFGFTATISYVLIWAARHAGIRIEWWDGAILILGSAFLASIPDIDIRLRRVGVRHRGFTHTVWFAILLAVPAYAVLDYLSKEGLQPPLSPLTASLTLALAVLTHIVADSLNYQRVRPLAPLSSSGIALRLFRSSNALANAGFFLMGAGLIAAYFYGVTDSVRAVQAAVIGSSLIIALAALLDRAQGRGRRR